MSYVPFFSHGDAATEAPDTDEADPCPQCGRDMRGEPWCFSCGYGEHQRGCQCKEHNLRNALGQKLAEMDNARAAGNGGRR